MLMFLLHVISCIEVFSHSIEPSITIAENIFLSIQKDYVSLQKKLHDIMPEVSRFYGIIIMMFADDHNPPHFHVRYGNDRAIVIIEKGIVQGRLPRKVLNRVYEWLDLHHDELVNNWNRLKTGINPIPIEPLYILERYEQS